MRLARACTPCRTRRIRAARDRPAGGWGAGHHALSRRRLGGLPKRLQSLGSFGCERPGDSVDDGWGEGVRLCHAAIHTLQSGRATGRHAAARARCELVARLHQDRHVPPGPEIRSAHVGRAVCTARPDAAAGLHLHLLASANPGATHCGSPHLRGQDAKVHRGPGEASGVVLGRRRAALLLVQGRQGDLLAGDRAGLQESPSAGRRRSHGQSLHHGRGESRDLRGHVQVLRADGQGWRRSHHVLGARRLEPPVSVRRHLRRAEEPNHQRRLAGARHRAHRRGQAPGLLLGGWQGPEKTPIFAVSTGPAWTAAGSRFSPRRAPITP